MASYVGRRHELVKVRGLLASGRVVTLTGTGGVGKTRLAVRVAASVREWFPGGVVFVKLAELQDARLVAALVGGELGLRHLSRRSALDAVAEHLRERRLLLVLDNCEHLASACAEFADAVRARCADVVVLATSRHPLGVCGESVLQVPPLRVPGAGEVRSPSELKRYDAARLFVDRARAVLPSFEVTEENYSDIALVCRQVEGLPLAIELAAARVRVLSVSQLARRLSTRLGLLTTGPRVAPERHRTLRATLDWSYGLCSEAEQRVWTRVSVFSGSFDRVAAEHVCGAGAAEVLDGLVDKSVLAREEQGESRYRMTEVLREYGQDLLEESGDRQRVARRHRDFYAALCGRFEAEWSGPEQVTWLGRIQRDYANIRAAFDFCLTEPAEAATALEMDRSLQDFLAVQGYGAEVFIRLDRALRLVPDDEPLRVTGLRRKASFALFLGDADATIAELVRAGVLAERLHHEVEAAYVAALWGLAALITGNPGPAVPLFENALKTFRARGVVRGEFFTQCCYGLVIGLSGERDRGRDVIQEEIARCVACGDIYWQAWSWFALAFLDVYLGETAAAEDAGQHALRLMRDIDNVLVKALTNEVLAIAAGERGEHTRAVMLLGIADALWAKMGELPKRTTAGVRLHHRYRGRARLALAGAQRILGDAVFATTFAEGRALAGDLALRYALGENHAASGDAETRQLTRREAEVAALIAQGLTNREIAGRLVIAQRTAEVHVQRILAKLGFTTRAQIAAWHSRTSPG
ncbi:ATP-binding protein [Amycolatopsis sp. NPDC059027]|uniref:ATP-binding protein n=1 Tax=unclassified Amycolatopsis TaxID=2618356 RepID=UPI00366F814D